MNRTLVTMLASALVCVSACETEKVPEPTVATPPAAVAPAPSAAPAPAPAAAAAGAPADNIPVAADFEDEAEKSITKANYKVELSALEAEIK